MRIFLAGASGVIGRQLTPLLVEAGHEVAGTTRSADRAELVRGLGASPGRASGVVRLLESSKDGSQMQQGEVLVTRMTSPHWCRSCGARRRSSPTPVA